MKTWEHALAREDMSLRETMRRIDLAGSKMALVVDENGRLVGTVSDGDVRRGLLAGLTLDDDVSEAMNRNPTVARVSETRYEILEMMRRRGLHQLPVVDVDGRVVGMEVIDNLLNTPDRENLVVIMAGGLGTRLEHLTRDTPKPMLRVGKRPLLETIIKGYAEQGFRSFYLAVNYKAEQIERYFGDGRAFGVNICYLRESQPLGTAGPLSLLPEVPVQPIVVTNGDLLAKEDFGSMVDQHLESRADATIAVREFDMQIPFGVVRERDGCLDFIEEKPTQRFTVSAGIYVLSPSVLELVPDSMRLDMPSLFRISSERGLSARCHRIEGYWVDIGRPPDFEQANQEFDKVFR